MSAQATKTKERQEVPTFTVMLPLERSSTRSAAPQLNKDRKRTPQDIFDRIEELKADLARKRDELHSYWMLNPDYARIEEEMEKLRARRTSLRGEINKMYPQLCDTIDILKMDLKDEKELFNDMMLAKVAKNERIEITDQYKQPCLPIFSVKMRPAR